MSVEDQLERISAEASRLDEKMRQMTLRPEYYLFDWALALFLWQAIANVRALKAMAEQGEVLAAPPIVRHLLEIGIDLAYLASLSKDDRTESAAFSIAWYIWQVDRQYQEIRNAESAGSSRRRGPRQPEEPERMLNRFCSSLERAGVDPAPLRSAFEEVKPKRPGILRNHWSGMTRTQVIDKVHEAQSSIVPSDFKAWADQLWVMTSTVSHSAPVWGRASLDVEPGQAPEVPDSYKSRDDHVLRIARASANFVGYFDALVQSARLD